MSKPYVVSHPRPVVDLVGIEPELLAHIIKTETGTGEQGVPSEATGGHQNWGRGVIVARRRS